MTIRIEDEPDVMGRVNTGGESWIHHFDPATKQESMHWKFQHSPVKKKVCQAKSMNKVILTLFFNARRAVYQHIVPRHTTISALYYCEVLRTLKRHVNKKRPNLKKIDFYTTTVLSCTSLPPSKNFQGKEKFAHRHFESNVKFFDYSKPLLFWPSFEKILQTMAAKWKERMLVCIVNDSGYFEKDIDDDDDDDNNDDEDDE